jgi:hypothetical protein
MHNSATVTSEIHAEDGEMSIFTKGLGKLKNVIHGKMQIREESTGRKS